MAKQKQIPKHLIKISKIESAREHLQEAYEILEEIFGDNSNVRAYFLEPLLIRISSDHGFLSNDLDIDKLIEIIENEGH